MYNSKRILGIIPARAGSVGLPQKNILPLLGRPLIVWTIEKAIASKYLDRVIVSTDNEEIAAVSMNYGAYVPFIRPEELSTGNAKAINVIMHSIDYFLSNNEFYDLVMLLQPTSPLRITQDIDNAVEYLFSKGAQSVVSVCESEYHPYLMNILPPDGNMESFLRPEAINSNRQELSVFYRLNGAIYLAYCDYLKSSMSFTGRGTFAYIMPQERSIDIDSLLDFKVAEALMTNTEKEQ